MSQDKNHDQELIATAERELAQAHVQMDLNKIDNLLHDEYTILQPNGAVENKLDVLASYNQGDRQWQSAAANDLDIAVSGNLALVTGKWTAVGQNGQGPFDYSTRFLSMWRKDNGQWQNIAYQSTEITEDDD